ncbi:MAG: PaaI family thioesterase [Coriobacteriales bacterium]|nr:PaaI family thioesterase [Coriobacteriales bacterium]
MSDAPREATINRCLPTLSRDASLAEVRACFLHDRFATEQAGCVIEEAAWGHAVCSLELDSRHLNAQGQPMGGAIFTLADFALAVASNIGEAPTVAVSNTIDYLTRARGTRLVATARALRSGRRLGFYQIDVHDETGSLVAQMGAKCYRDG